MVRNTCSRGTRADFHSFKVSVARDDFEKHERGPLAEQTVDVLLLCGLQGSTAGEARGNAPSAGPASIEDVFISLANAPIALQNVALLVDAPWPDGIPLGAEGARRIPGT